MKPSNPLHPRKIFGFFILSIALTWATATSAFSDPGKRADAEALTQSLVGLSKAYHVAAPTDRSRALQELIDLTVERQALLAELVRTDPGAVLRTAIPERIRQQMPVEVQPFIERRVGLEGELEVLYEDRPDGTHRLLHRLRAARGPVSLHFEKTPAALQSGVSVRARGVLVDDSMAIAANDEDLLLLALGDSPDVAGASGSPAPLANTLGEQRVAVLLVNFPTNASQPWTAALVRDVFFGDVNAFYRENSQDQTWFSGEVFGWYTLPLDPAGCPTTDIALAAQQAAVNDGVDLTGYDRFVYAFPDIGCSWSGLGTVGGTPSRAWFDGTMDSAAVVSHELGHNFGLYHSHAQACSGELPFSDVCVDVEYGDVLDRMGQANGGHFNAFQKERLGWLDHGNSPPIVTAEATGSYAMEVYASASNGTKAVRIPRDLDPQTGQQRWYYLESRQPVGFDGFLASSNYEASVTNGVIVRLGTWASADSSYLLDMTPGSQLLDFRDLALPLGQRYTDEGAGLSITVDAVDGGGAAVYVSYGAGTCERARPTVELRSTTEDWVTPGTAVDFMLTVWNNDGSACADAAFDLVGQAPEGWAAVLPLGALSLAPGASAATVLTVTSPLDAPDGIYDVVATAAHRSDPGLVGSAAATYVVAADTGTVSNTPPVAVDDAVVLQQVESVTIDVLENDWDPDNDTVHVVAWSQGVKGAVALNPDGTLTYTPGKRFKDKDSFDYEVSDGSGTATATVLVTLEGTSRGGGKGGGKTKN